MARTRRAGRTLARDKAEEAKKEDAVELAGVQWEQAVSPTGPTGHVPAPAEGPSNERIMNGDTVTLRASFTPIDPADQVKVTIDAGSDREVEIQKGWQGTGQIDFKFKPLEPGNTTFTARLQAEGGDEQHKELSFTVMADITQAMIRLEQAESMMDGKANGLDAAALGAASQFKAGYEKFTAGLGTAKKADELTQDVLLGILFAAIPGGIGGAIGRALNDRGQPDWAVDAVKDLVKWSLRTPGGTLVAELGKGGSPPSSPAAGTKDPLDVLLSLGRAAKLASQQVKFQMAKNKSGLAAAQSMGEKAFEGNPMDAAAGVTVFDEMASGLNVSSTSVLKNLWRDWIVTNVRRRSITPVSNNEGPMPRFQIVDNLTAGQRSAIFKAAAECGEEGQAWIDSAPLEGEGSGAGAGGAPGQGGAPATAQGGAPSNAQGGAPPAAQGGAPPNGQGGAPPNGQGGAPPAAQPVSGGQGGAPAR